MKSAVPLLKKCLQPAGMLWVSWPKKASKLATEISGADAPSWSRERGKYFRKNFRADKNCRGHTRAVMSLYLLTSQVLGVERRFCSGLSMKLACCLTIDLRATLQVETKQATALHRRRS